MYRQKCSNPACKGSLHETYNLLPLHTCPNCGNHMISVNDQVSPSGNVLAGIASGAAIGGLLGGGAGAILGALIGSAIAQSVNEAERKKRQFGGI
jgi:predicted RNA-binding Zn-ribbon protein involved in translation (DUF1610 family)